MINVKIHEQQEYDKNVKTSIKTKVKVVVYLIILSWFTQLLTNNNQPLKLFVVNNFRCPFIGQKVSL